jgi:hypothetical protein
VSFTTVRESVTPVATSAVVNAPLTWVALMNEVGRGLPFTSITVVGTNPVPVTVTVGEAVPVSSVAGETDARVGAGLSISRSIGDPGEVVREPFATTTANSAPLASWLAGTTAVSSVLSTKVVASATLLTETTLVLRNPEPVTVSTSEPEPAGSFAGLIDDTTGVVGVCCPPPFPAFEPPPQPPATMNTPRPKSKAERRKGFIASRLYGGCPRTGRLPCRYRYEY